MAFKDIFSGTFKEISKTSISRFSADPQSFTGLYSVINQGLNHLYRLAVKNYAGFYKQISNDYQDKGTISAISLNDETHNFIGKGVQIHLQPVK